MLIVLLLLAATFGMYKASKHMDLNLNHAFGDRIDSLNGVYVYYNGGMDHVDGRCLAPGNYNIGLRYQCVEFVKRYYYEYYQHKMPETYGDAKDYYDPRVSDGTLNPQRDLVQFSNPGTQKPEVGDIVVFKGNLLNSHGHVAIVYSIENDIVEVIQQNTGSFGSSRAQFELHPIDNKWQLNNDRILGWLRMKEN